MKVVMAGADPAISWHTAREMHGLILGSGPRTKGPGMTKGCERGGEKASSLFGTQSDDGIKPGGFSCR